MTHTDSPTPRTDGSLPDRTEDIQFVMLHSGTNLVRIMYLTRHSQRANFNQKPHDSKQPRKCAMIVNLQYDNPGALLYVPTGHASQLNAPVLAVYVPGK